MSRRTYTPNYNRLSFNKSSKTELTRKDVEKLGLNKKRFITKDDISGYKKIGEKAFAGSEYLFSIDIPESVTEIKDHAFESCRNLKTVNLSNSITKIGYGSFLLSGLEYVFIPNSVEKIDDYAFAGCEHLLCVKFEGIEWPSIGKSAFRECGLKSITFRQHTKNRQRSGKIGNDAFSNNKNLLSVELLCSKNILNAISLETCENLKTVYCWDKNTKKLIDNAKNNNGLQFDIIECGLVDKNGNIIPSLDIINNPQKYGLI